jgi:hypothetical protein
MVQLDRDVRHKVIIAGTGRAGTTALVRLLTECGIDTGFTAATWQRHFLEHCQAGLERDLLERDAPYVVKSPDLCETLPDILATGRFVIDHAIVPVRDLEDAARSRARIGGTNASVPGGLWGTDDPARQKEALAERFHRLMHTLAVHDIPVTLLAFPQFVSDPGYAYRKLRFLIGHIPPDDFADIFRQVADPGRVHEFGREPLARPGRDPAPAREYAALLQQRERRRQRRRILRRLAAGVGAALLAGFAAWRHAWGLP